jgi:hypothetical protein
VTFFSRGSVFWRLPLIYILHAQHSYVVPPLLSSVSLFLVSVQLLTLSLRDPYKKQSELRREEKGIRELHFSAYISTGFAFSSIFEITLLFSATVGESYRYIFTYIFTAGATPPWERDSTRGVLFFFSFELSSYLASYGSQLPRSPPRLLYRDVCLLVVVMECVW